VKRLALFIIFPIAVFATPSASASTTEDVEAPFWIIMDAETGRILDSERAHDQMPMASLTKVMTALIAIEQGDLTQRVTIVEEDLIGEASADLEDGQVLTLHTLLYGVLLESGNDAAMALARAVGGSPHTESEQARDRFVGWMNYRASELGMVNTRFVNPHGLDEPGHYSTAYDLALLTRNTIQNPDFLEIFSTKEFEDDVFEWEHGNKLLGEYPEIIGGKPGWTSGCGRCQLQLAERDDRRLVVVLLGSTKERRYDDVVDLYEYAWSLPKPATTRSAAADTFEWWRVKTDGPVEQGKTERSWMWGDWLSRSVQTETYDDAPDGRRFVQYFDKGRMEDGEVQLRWPAASSSAPVTYSLTSEPVVGGRATWSTSGRTWTFDGLDNGTVYTFRVTPVNEAGPGPTASVAAQPVGTPEMIGLSVTPTGDRSFDVDFTYDLNGAQLDNCVVSVERPGTPDDAVVLPEARCGTDGNGSASFEVGMYNTDYDVTARIQTPVRSDSDSVGVTTAGKPLQVDGSGARWEGSCYWDELGTARPVVEAPSDACVDTPPDYYVGTAADGSTVQVLCWAEDAVISDDLGNTSGTWLRVDSGWMNALYFTDWAAAETDLPAC
jgi:D-alanyl-D-alanine carboxypeptidase